MARHALTINVFILRQCDRCSEIWAEIRRSSKDKKLDSDCTEAVLLTARDKEDELFDRMAEGLNSANARELVAAAAQKSALAYLSARGIDIGVARRLQFAQCNNLKIEYDLELQENVAEAAWRLVNGEPEDIEEATPVSVAFNAYKRTCIPKYARVLTRFLAANEDRQLTNFRQEVGQLSKKTKPSFAPPSSKS